MGFDTYRGYDRRLDDNPILAVAVPQATSRSISDWIWRCAPNHDHGPRCVKIDIYTATRYRFHYTVFLDDRHAYGTYSYRPLREV
jgi:hypothetical protein